jgi:hypothetical protein
MFYVQRQCTPKYHHRPWPFKHTAAYLRSKRPVSSIIRFSHERLIDPLNRILAAQNTIANVLVKSPKQNGKEKKRLTSSPPPKHPTP